MIGFIVLAWLAFGAALLVHGLWTAPVRNDWD